jgi:hypothetical protein
MKKTVFSLLTCAVLAGTSFARDGKEIVVPYGTVFKIKVRNTPSAYQPDTRLGFGPGVSCGKGIFNLTGVGQSLRCPIPKDGGGRTLFIGIQNAGSSTDAFKVRGTNGNLLFDVRYYHGKRDVTHAVTHGNFSTGRLAPGRMSMLRMTIITFDPPVISKRLISIVSESETAPTSKDYAMIRAWSY